MDGVVPLTFKDEVDGIVLLEEDDDDVDEVMFHFCLEVEVFKGSVLFLTEDNSVTVKLAVDPAELSLWIEGL